MPILNLQTVKSHLRIDSNDEDSLLNVYIAAAESHAEEYLNRPLQPWNEENDPVPATIIQALLLAVGDFYENREAVSENPYNKNPAFASLLNWHRLELGI